MLINTEGDAELKALLLPKASSYVQAHTYKRPRRLAPQLALADSNLRRGIRHGLCN